MTHYSGFPTGMAMLRERIRYLEEDRDNIVRYYEGLDEFVGGPAASPPWTHRFALTTIWKPAYRPVEIRPKVRELIVQVSKDIDKAVMDLALIEAKLPPVPAPMVTVTCPCNHHSAQ